MTTPILRFAKCTWPMLNRAAEEERVALVPAGTIEDHGLHLPVDTDVVIAERICELAAAQATERTILLPPITFGFSPHHIDGPGTLTLRWDTFVASVRDVAASLVYHGFRKILIINGHGSNEPVLDLAARQTVVEHPDVLCAYTSWWSLKKVQECVRTLRESEWTGHACELETSLYLAFDPSRVHMEHAQRDVNPYMSKHFWADLVGQPPEGYANPIKLTEYWSTVSETGTWGDPTCATAEKGHTIAGAAAAEIAEVIHELAARPIRQRQSHQLPAVEDANAQRGPRSPAFT